MTRYASFSDEHYINLNLTTEMDLPSGRETLLHFFEQVQRKYPGMKNFYGRERNEYVLEEDKEAGNYRWVTVEPRRVLSGYVNPATTEEALVQHEYLLELVPFALSLSPLDCKSLNLTYGFDYQYRGNHNQLVAEALGVVPAYEKLLEGPAAMLVSYEPSVQFAWEQDCRVQARLGVETRTSPIHIRTGDFPEEEFSIYLTARRSGSLEPGETFGGVMRQLANFCHDLLDGHIVEHVLRPVQQAIALK
jgi:hypothetical protein